MLAASMTHALAALLACLSFAGGAANLVFDLTRALRRDVAMRLHVIIPLT